MAVQNDLHLSGIRGALGICSNTVKHYTPYCMMLNTEPLTLFLTLLVQIQF